MSDTSQPNKKNIDGKVAALRMIIKTLTDAVVLGKDIAYVKNSLVHTVGKQVPGLDYEPVQHINSSEFMDSFGETISEYTNTLKP